MYSKASAQIVGPRLFPRAPYKTAQAVGELVHHKCCLALAKMDDQDAPNVKELIVYYEAAAAEDLRKAESLRRRLKRAERAEKRRSRHLSRLQEMSLPKIRKAFKVSSPAKRTPQKLKVVEEPPRELEILVVEGIDSAPLPEPLFDAANQSTVETDVVIPEESLDTLIAECADILSAPVANDENVAPFFEEVAAPVAEPEQVVVEVPAEEKIVETVVEVAEEPEIEEAAVAEVATAPKDNLRSFVAAEILATERTYVDGLRKCISVRGAEMAIIDVALRLTRIPRFAVIYGSYARKGRGQRIACTVRKHDEYFAPQ